MSELNIIEELRTLLPPLSEAEYAGLEASIVNDGCRDALVAWNEILIDGHHRYAICKKHKITFNVTQVVLDSIDDAKLWIWSNQTSRRNLTDYHRAESALKLEEAIASKAKERQGKRNDLIENNIPANLPECKETREELAKLANISPRSLAKVKYIAKHADEETKNNLRKGEKGTSIDKVFNQLKKAEKIAAEEEEKAASKKNIAKNSAKSQSMEESRTTETTTAATEKQTTQTNSPHCRPGEKPGATGEPYVGKTTFKDMPHDQPEILIASLMLHFPREYVKRTAFLIVDSVRKHEGAASAKELARSIWQAFNKK